MQCFKIVKYVKQIAKYNSNVMVWSNTRQVRSCQLATMNQLVYLHILEYSPCKCSETSELNGEELFFLL